MAGAVAASWGSFVKKEKAEKEKNEKEKVEKGKLEREEVEKENASFIISSLNSGEDEFDVLICKQHWEKAQELEDERRKRIRSLKLRHEILKEKEETKDQKEREKETNDQLKALLADAENLALN